MNVDEREFYSLLDEHGAVLERQKKHNIYRFPDGRTFTMPRSGSDCRGMKNAIAVLRRFLGVTREVRKNPNRREKTPPSPQRYIAAEVVDLPDWKRQLKDIQEGRGENMIEMVYKCDGVNCKEVRGPANGWLIFKLTEKPIFEVRAWDDQLAKRKDYGHLCSDQCAIKKMIAMVRKNHRPAAHHLVSEDQPVMEEVQ